MPPPEEWTDADFVPREPQPAAPDERAAAAADRDRREWCRREIRSRLGSGETPAQVIAWLAGEGLDPGAAARLVAWASAAGPPPPGGSAVNPGLVVGVEVHSQLEEDGPALVNTDPVLSARARAAARRQRAAGGEADAPAPEFGFAQPAEAAQSRLAHGKGGNWVIPVAVLLCLAAAFAAILLLVS